MKLNMKVAVCVLALIVAAQAVPIEKDNLGVAVKNVYEKFWRALPCGIAGSGPLDPYVINEKYTKAPFEIGDKDFK